MTSFEKMNLAVEIKGTVVELCEDNLSDTHTISPEEYAQYDFPYTIQGIDRPSEADE